MEDRRDEQHHTAAVIKYAQVEQGRSEQGI